MPSLRVPGRAAILVIAAALPLRAQTPSSPDLLQTARGLVAAHPDSALLLLRTALVAATTQPESVTVLVWTAIAQFYAAPDSIVRDSLTRDAFRAAFALKPDLTVSNLEQASARLADLFAAERRANVVHPSGDVAAPPQLVSGPTVVYPWDVWRRGISGRATIEAVVDTAGRVEPATLRVVAVPDSALAEPVRRMALASAFSRGRMNDGTVVRTLIRMTVMLTPGPPPNPTDLLNEGRRLAAGQPDSALALVTMALDSAVHATAGVRLYAYLVRGLAGTAQGRDTLAAAAFDTALAEYRDLIARRVDLAPFLRRLADSVRLARRGSQRAVTTMVRLAVVGSIDEPPVLVSHPAIRYPPELWQLRVGGTVIVEATLDAAGRAVAGSVKVLQSPNPGFDAEARRVVLASVYRPGRRGGAAVQTVIRQPITFAP